MQHEQYILRNSCSYVYRTEHARLYTKNRIRTGHGCRFHYFCRGKNQDKQFPCLNEHLGSFRSLLFIAWRPLTVYLSYTSTIQANAYVIGINPAQVISSKSKIGTYENRNLNRILKDEMKYKPQHYKVLYTVVFCPWNMAEIIHWVRRKPLATITSYNRNRNAIESSESLFFFVYFDEARTN